MNPEARLYPALYPGCEDLCHRLQYRIRIKTESSFPLSR
jgi:hypothetical protein